jgi:hypothetical protein
MKIKWVLFMVMSFAALVYADGAATWEPAEPLPGDSITIVYDPTIGTLKESADSIKLHWGINETSHGAWIQPPPEVWPPGSIPWSDGRAIQSRLTKIANDHWEITIATLDTFRTVHFVFTSGGSGWDNNFGANWDIYLGGGPEPVEHTDTVTVQVLVNLGSAIQNRGFTPGDTVEARFGFYGTGAQIDTLKLQRQAISNYYSGVADVVTTIGDTINYGYFAYKNRQANWEVFYNFNYTGDTQGEAQYRQIPVTGETIVIQDTVNNSLSTRRPPFFRNLSVVAQDVAVTLTCDLRPAYYHLLLGGDPLEDIQGDLDVMEPDSVLSLGVAVNGPITGSWSNSLGPDWGAHLMQLDNKRMYDDGTHGDVVVGDTIYSIVFNFYHDSSDVVGQEFKFGIGGGDNEGGYGNNHVENIDDSQPASTIAAQFGSIDPVFYSEWDYINRQKTDVEASDRYLPDRFILEQNYPNPFNPTTKIQYRLLKSVKVNLSVYNVLGEKVISLVNTKQPAGQYEVVWDGRDNLGRSVCSGLYFYRIEADNFVKAYKMMLLK